MFKSPLSRRAKTPRETAVTKPSIVFAHGLWADGSCFSKLIPTLQTEGHDVMASQHGLDSPQAQSQRPNANWRRPAKGDGPARWSPLSRGLSVCNVGFWALS